MNVIQTEAGLDPGRLLFSGKTHIPVRNLWLLMFYASELFAEDASVREAGMEESPDDLIDLISEVLVTAAERRLHRPLSRRYVAQQEDLSRVRGRIDHLQTYERNLQTRGRVACSFDELSVDHLLNQVITSGLIIAERASRNAGLRERAATARRTFHWSGVSRQFVSAAKAESLTLGRNDEAERRCASAARLLLQMGLLTEDIGTDRAVTPRLDIDRWRLIYEAAVRGFFHAVLQEPWRVRLAQEQHRWPLQDPSAGMARFMPTMETDVVLRRPGERIVIETKFTSPISVHSQFGGQTFKRDHLFQLQTYLTTMARVPGERLTGVLLYPQVEDAVDMTAKVGAHTLRVKTIDLTGTSATIRDELLSVVAGA
ncbi:5-methylcytosine restriction system specificity protein McrC [Nesterenkonia sandarakina]|nr:5-methylcytosine-specific restriction system specificity protein McrC [Nesterenkonia sandarakina]